MKLDNNKKIFDDMGGNYIREDGHWGADLDSIKFSINALLPTTPSLKYLDAGCGPGFHIAAIGELYPEISITGVDYSPTMVNTAKNRVTARGLKNIEVAETDLIKWAPDRRYDIITLLNNSLGNLYQDGASPTTLRQSVIERLRQSLNPNGHLIVSVYSRDAMNPNYGPNLSVRPESDVTQGDLFVDYKTAGQMTTYYSHWFSEPEIRQLLEDAGLTIDFLERRMARFLLRAVSKK